MIHINGACPGANERISVVKIKCRVILQPDADGIGTAAGSTGRAETTAYGEGIGRNVGKCGRSGIIITSYDGIFKAVGIGVEVAGKVDAEASLGGVGTNRLSGCK